MPASTSAPPRRLLVTVAVLLVLVTAVFGGLQLIDHVVSSRWERTSVLAPHGPQVMVQADHGDVVIGPSEDGMVHVQTRISNGLATPHLEEEPTATGIRLSASCPFLFGNCTVDYDVRVPPTLGVEVFTTSGEVTVRAVGGGARAETSSGDITITDVTGPVQLRSSTGKITASALHSPTISSETSSGDIELKTLVPPDTVTATSSTGDVDIVLPDSVRYRVETDTDVGDEHVTVPLDSAASRLVRVNTSAGDITVRAAAPTPR